MTTEFVPFRATLQFGLPARVRDGRLVWVNDNPSERREIDDALVIPVRFE